MEEIKKSINRAKQFMPFASLKGYYDLIIEREKIIEPKRELSEEKIEKISIIINSLKKGDYVRVKFYKNDGYITKEGIVSNLNIELHKIEVLKQVIEFENIYDIKILNNMK